MGIAGIKIKIMPESLESNLEEIKEKAKAIVEEKGGKNREYEEEPIAFGLKAVIAFFELSEEIESGKIEEALNSIEGVSSAQVIDMRRLI
ncbi:elongation factor 1-beta [Candidatus Pacearchaeota archaeon]|nr:elongation factor 1-beta [Candidatus Pacearchaeota archaeon]